MAETEKRSKLPVTVNKPTPYTFDLGLLLANDPNPLVLDGELEDDLSATARDGAQALLNQLLTTCPIQSTPAGVLLSLPAIETNLPREKVRPSKSLPSQPQSSPPFFIIAKTNPQPQPLPPPKTETTWSRFAAKKGIKAKDKAARQKLVYDDATGEWVPKWGYKGANKAHESDWIVEVDMKKERERKEAGRGIEGSGMQIGGDGRRDRKERVKRAERLQRANDRKGRRSENMVLRK